MKLEDLKERRNEIIEMINDGGYDLKETMNYMVYEVEQGCSITDIEKFFEYIVKEYGMKPKIFGNGSFMGFGSQSEYHRSKLGSKWN